MSGRDADERVVRKVMGTAVTMAFRSPLPREIIDEAFAWLDRVEAMFSTFLPDSEISRIAAGDLAESDADPLVRDVLDTCSLLRLRTDGWFEFEPSANGLPRLDPAGYVKGWAIDGAAEILTAAGIDDFFLSAGGDVVVRSSGRPWRVGVRHPQDAAATAAVLLLDNAAVATSGLYERGRHIRGQTTPTKPAFRSVTIVGSELGVADALATALFASADATAPWLGRFADYDVLLVTGDGRVRSTPGLESKLEQSSADVAK